MRSVARPNRRVLQGRHAAAFLVERVEKLTDNKSTWLFCVAQLMLILRKDQPVVGPGAFPTPPGSPTVSDGSAPHHLFHFSLRFLCTAMLAGLRTLIQTRHGPNW